MVKMGKVIEIGDVVLRDYSPVSDEAFIFSTWIKSFRDSAFARAVPAPIYDRSQRARIENVLSRKDTYALIAKPKGTPELILGYCVGQVPNIIHYVYVKKDYRGNRITPKLFWYLQEWSREHPVLYTHKPAPIWIEKALQEKEELKNFIYDPYALERK